MALTFTHQGSTYKYTVTFPSPLYMTDGNVNSPPPTTSIVFARDKTTETFNRYFEFRLVNSSGTGVNRVPIILKCLVKFTAGSKIGSITSYEDYGYTTGELYQLYNTTESPGPFQYIQAYFAVRDPSSSSEATTAKYLMGTQKWILYNRIYPKINSLDISYIPITGNYILPSNYNLLNFTDIQLNGLVTYGTAELLTQNRVTRFIVNDINIQDDLVPHETSTYSGDIPVPHDILNQTNKYTIVASNYAGNSISSAKTFSFNAPNKPRISDLVIKRGESNGEIIINGTYYIDTTNKDIYEQSQSLSSEELQVLNRQYNKIKLSCKLTNNGNDIDFDEFIDIIYGNEFDSFHSFSFSKNLDLDEDLAYDFSCELEDNIPDHLEDESVIYNTSLLYTDQLSTGFFILDISEDGKGVGLGTVATDEEERQEYDYYLSTDTEADLNKTYFEKIDSSYIQVEQSEGDNPSALGWYEYLPVPNSKWTQLNIGFDRIKIDGTAALEKLEPQAEVISAFSSSGFISYITGYKWGPMVHLELLFKINTDTTTTAGITSLGWLKISNIPMPILTVNTIANYKNLVLNCSLDHSPEYATLSIRALTSGTWSDSDQYVDISFTYLSGEREPIILQAQ